MQLIESIKKILKKNHLRITKARLSVLDILIHAQQEFLSSEEIFHHIQNRADLECDQVSVYRTLTLLERLEIVLKSSFQGEAARFRLNVNYLTHTISNHCNSDQESSGHHTHASVHEHFFKCLGCYKIEPFKGCVVVHQEQEFLRKGYKDLRHHLEIVGLCPTCAVN